MILYHVEAVVQRDRAMGERKDAVWPFAVMAASETEATQIVRGHLHGVVLTMRAYPVAGGVLGLPCRLVNHNRKD